MSEKCKTCDGAGSVPAEVETAEGPIPCPYVGAPCPDCSPMPEKLIVVRESEWRQMRKALAKCAEGWGNAVEFDLLPRRYHAAATCLRDEARAALAHPTPDGCGREGEQIEAAARAIANAWGETWECCCTEQRGLDCDCGDAMPDGRDGYYERLTRDDCRRAARAALSAFTAGGDDD